MTRDQIAEASYDAANVLAQCEFEAGRISEERLRNRTGRTEVARSLMHEVDAIMAIKDTAERDTLLWGIKEKGMEMMNSTVCEKDDLVWESKPVWASAPRALRGLMFPLKRD
jgi:hypothetical protein